MNKKFKQMIGIIVGVAMLLAVSGFAISTAQIVQSVEPMESDTSEIQVYEDKLSEELKSVDDVNEASSEILEEVDDPTSIKIDESETEVDEENQPEYLEYTVQAGDSFWKISKTYLGDGNKYVELAASNQMSATDYIHPGDVLRIYTDAESLEEAAASYAPVEIESVVVEEKEEPKKETVYNYDDILGPSSFNGDMSVEEATALLKDGSNVDTSAFTYAGNFKITAYDPHCAHCCGKTNGITASGNPAEFGTSVGCNTLPLGTIIYIKGYGFFRVDDVGGSSKNLIDIAAPSHDACYQLTGRADVYIVG